MTNYTKGEYKPATDKERRQLQFISEGVRLYGVRQPTKVMKYVDVQEAEWQTRNNKKHVTKEVKQKDVTDNE